MGFLRYNLLLSAASGLPQTAQKRKFPANIRGCCAHE
jgi:hypothetical protein